ncbi:MAG: hypothetical protein JXR96_04805 [Deltaproteobacteria bacterium]|nr:hypothetical protein [Deltaproteobacteria bacterium]
MKPGVLLCAAIGSLVLMAAGRAGAGEISVASLPPVVVETTPRSGDRVVDPGLKEIRVRFSKDMLTERMWSFVQIDPASYPKTTGQPHYLKDRRSIVLPVELAPGKAYAIWINKGQFNAFRDTGQRPAVPYLLVFETRKN